MHPLLQPLSVDCEGCTSDQVCMPESCEQAPLPPQFLGNFPTGVWQLALGPINLSPSSPWNFLRSCLLPPNKLRSGCVSAGAMNPMTSFFLAMTGTPCSHAFWACNAMHTHYIMLLLVLQVVQIVHMGQHAPCYAALV